MTNTLRAQFLRTICACPECTGWCRRMPGCLAPGDAERIADWLGTTIEAVEAELEASPGALVVYEGRIGRIGTIVPARKSDGTCGYLDNAGRCTIHPVAPFGCAYFDAHQSQREGNRRSQAMLRSILESDDYRAMRARLIAAGRIAQAPEVLRQTV